MSRTKTPPSRARPVTVFHFPKGGAPQAKSSRAPAPPKTITELVAVTFPGPEATLERRQERRKSGSYPAHVPGGRRKGDRSRDDGVSSGPKPRAEKAEKAEKSEKADPKSERRADRHSKSELIGEQTEQIPEGTLQQMLSKRKKTQEESVDLALFGHQLFEAGRVDEAREVFERLVESKTEVAFPYTMLGTIHLAQNELETATKLFTLALGYDPDDTAALVYRAEIRLHRGHSRSAVEALQKVSKKDPHDPFVRRAQKLLKLVARKPK